MKVFGVVSFEQHGITLIDLRGKYPNHVMTIVLKGKGFNYKPADYIAKWVYVGGKVQIYKDKPEIV